MVYAEEHRRTRFLPLSSYWFAVNMQSAALLAIAVPESLLRFAGAGHTTALARVAAMGAIVSMVVPPAMGWVSDRWKQRGIQRRTIVVAGAVANVAGLLAMAQATSLTTLTLAFMLTMLGQNAALAAFEALLPDVVPENAWGRASGAMGVATLTGSIFGLISAGLLGAAWAYEIMAVTTVSALVLTYWVHETPKAEQAAEPASEVPKSRHDFGVTFVARFLIMLGLTFLLTFVLYFFQDVLHVQNPGEGTATVAGVALIGAVISTWAIGHIADRVKKSYVVAASGVPMALAVFGFALFPEERVIFALGILYGLGYGAFLSSDWALALATLPDRHHRARDLGIWGIASSLPNVVAPAIGGVIITAYALPAVGYRVLFAVSGACLLLGSAVVLGVGRPENRTSLLHMAFMAFIAGILTAYVKIAYRSRIIGRLPFRRGATLVVANHNQDLEGMVLPAALFLGGPWTRPVYSAGSRRLFEPYFLWDRAPKWLRPLVAWLPLMHIMSALGVLPIENQPRRRPLSSLLYDIRLREGDLPLASVMTAEGLAELSQAAGVDLSAARLSDVWRRARLRDAGRREASYRLLQPAYREQMKVRTREMVREQFARLKAVLVSGGTLYLTPEGMMSPDGRLHRFKEILRVLQPLADQVFIATPSCDPFASGRLAMTLRIVRASSPDLRGEILRARPITVSQVLAEALIMLKGPAYPEEIAEAALGGLDTLPAEACLVPAAKSDWARRIRGEIATLRARRILIDAGDGRLVLSPNRHDRRFSHIPDIVVACANMLADARAAFATAQAAPEPATSRTEALGGGAQRYGS